jgi:hypothetical protein
MRSIRAAVILLFVGLLGLAAPASAFETLYQRTFSVDLRDYASGNGAQVAVGYRYGDTVRGNLLTSVNGTDWCQTDLPDDASFGSNAVTFFNGRFIVAAPAAVYTSDTGSDWSKAAQADSFQLNDMAAGGPLLLGVGSGVSYWSGRIMSSRDGVTWLTVTEGLTYGLNAVAYGTASGTFAAVGNYGDIYTYRSGSVAKRAEIGYDLSDVAYGNGTFVAVGSHGAVVSSTNTAKNRNSNNEGTTWILRASGTTNTLISVAYGNGTFVAGGVDVVLTSPDGTTWTKRSFGTPAATGKIRFDGAKFIAVGDDGVILTSVNGITWSTVIPATPGRIARIASSDTMIAATGSSKGTVLTSPDGAHWTARYLPDGAVSLTGMAYGSGLFVGIGNGNFGDPAMVMTSPDGINWTRRELGTYSYVNDIAFGNNAFVVVTDSNAIFTSFDGVYWIPGNLDTRGLNSIIFKNGMFIAVGSSGALFVSPNGVSWEKWIPAPWLTLAQIEGGTQTSAMLSDQGLLFTSSGYRNWRQRTSPFGSLFQPRFLGFGNNTFLSGDEHGEFLVSPDGRNWSGQPLTPLFIPRSALFFNDTFIITGEPYYEIRTSTNKGGVIFQSAKVEPMGPPAPEPEIQVLPAALDYGSVKRGQSVVKTITITNTWTGDLSIAAELKGTHRADYPITGGSCGQQATLMPDESCTIEATFGPTTAFTRTAEITVTSNDLQTPVVTIPLTGIGLQPLITPPSPLPVNLGNVAYPQFAAANVLVKNQGNDTLQVASATLAGSSEFRVNFDGCTGDEVQGGSWCAVQVLFIPQSAGSKSAVLTVVSNDPDHPVLEIPIIVTVL